MLAVVQPFGLGTTNGGSRILKSLLRDPVHPFISIVTGTAVPPPVPSLANQVITEVHVPQRPPFGRLERTRISMWLTALEVGLGGRLARRLEQVYREHAVGVVHTIAHGPDFCPAYRSARAVGARYVVNVHDDLRYVQQRSPVLDTLQRQLGTVWCEADARLSVSQELGEEYNRRFGKRDFQIVTDGVECVGTPHTAPSPDALHVHFGGSLHLSYKPNFDQLLIALTQVKAANPRWKISLTLRGCHLDVHPPGIEVKSLPPADQEAFDLDLKQADLLYLPLPFEERFLPLSKFSLSTKMISYLASGTPVLYHGPADAAAGALLGRHHAALMAAQLDGALMTQCLLAPLSERAQVAENGLRLAASQFKLSVQQQAFWRELFPEHT